MKDPVVPPTISISRGVGVGVFGGVFVGVHVAVRVGAPEAVREGLGEGVGEGSAKPVGVGVYPLPYHPLLLQPGGGLQDRFHKCVG